MKKKHIKNRNLLNTLSALLLIGLVLTTSCRIVPPITGREPARQLPRSYTSVPDTGMGVGSIKWKQYFTDPYLNALIDTALERNQELNITLQELVVASNEVRARKGEYLPFVGLGAGVGLTKVGRYTSQGASDGSARLEDGQAVPDPLQNYYFGPVASWELDVWHKLRNAKKAAALRYLAGVEGRNFMVTNLVAEIANSYYELVALDKQLQIIQQFIGIQEEALHTVRLQKEAARVTELSVLKFEAELLKTQGRQYSIRQRIIETENRINFLLGRFPQPIPRTEQPLNNLLPDTITAGIPARLIENRPDIRRAEQLLASARLDVASAKANFYPKLSLTAGIGYNALNLGYFLRTPESLVFSLVGDAVAPMVNRNAIKATYFSANARQIQSAYTYEQTMLNAYREVVNQLWNIRNLKNGYELKNKEVRTFNESIKVANNLFRSTRADYMEVLMTQRDALTAQLELIDIQEQRLHAFVNLYRALGGGWM
jgi:NodT family efflux transporter outer membrane factor (OMF) lipoprotein